MCGDADNCPEAFNPLQVDSNGDGAGDACRPSVSIGRIQRTSDGRLLAPVAIGDPDGDLLSGQVQILPAAVDARHRC